MDLAVVLARQGGTVGLGQALTCGLSDDAVRRRVRSRRWRQVYPRVFHASDHPWTDTSRTWAVVLWLGPRGVLSGPAAAFVHGLADRAPPVVGVTVPQRSRLRGRPGIVVRRRDLAPEDLGVRRGIRLTGVELTVLETALALPDGAAFLDRALQRHVPLPPLVAAYHRNLGARGWSRLRPLLVAAQDRTASRLERLFLQILRDAHLTGWVANLRIGSWEADVAFPEQRVAIELDGWAWHVEPGRFQGDRTKQNSLALTGWTVLRFTWADVTQRPDHVRAVVRRALALAA
ncbi:DUF559 domain-containing protein [Pseudonocardia oroxyli]|uniref:DUF559 domain-containing protein n=1 Tax=Pseudonocardia oroxyli TaxID=366584 RepID=UPI0015A27429|nr:DUF559 domain-containing protein [Pseudonocardia oroxyli]